MSKPGIEDLLIRCVLEPELLQRLRESPDAVFGEFELTDRAREILAAPDARLLELLGEAMGLKRTEAPTAQSETPEPDSPESDSANEQAAEVTSLPQSRLVLRLVPYVQQFSTTTGEVPDVIVNYAGHLDPLPEGTEIGDLPDVPTTMSDGQRLPALAVIVGIQPTVWTDDAGNRQITFSVGAQLPQEAAADHAAETSDTGLSPWRHDVDSSAVEAAAKEVHGAKPGGRYERLRDLIDVMVAPADAAGDA